jgi:glycosyltransferase involved in cell wall biosynthesis
MKIALFVPSWPPGLTPNGIVTYASQLVPALRRLGHKVFVLTPEATEEQQDPYTIDLREFASTSKFWDGMMFRLAPDAAGFNAASSAIAAAVRRLVDKYQLNVVEMEESFGWSYAVSRLNLLPVVVRLHGPWFLTGRFNDPSDDIPLNRNRPAREGKAIRKAQFVTAPSAAVLQAVRAHYGSQLTQSRVIPNPLDAAAEADIWSIERCDNDNLLFVGRFDRRKGGDLVLLAFRELAASYPKLKLTFVGPDIGIKGADRQVSSFEKFTRDNLPEWCRARVDFRGQLSRSDVTSLRVNSFATVVASQYEMMPYSVLEAMSLGCPIVATSVGGIPELLKDRQNGLLVPSQDVGALARACARLLDGPALAVQLGRQAWRDCRDLYGSERIAKQTVNAYEEAVNSCGLGRSIIGGPRVCG